MPPRRSRRPRQRPTASRLPARSAARRGEAAASPRLAPAPATPRSPLVRRSRTGIPRRAPAPLTRGAAAPLRAAVSGRAGGHRSPAGHRDPPSAAAGRPAPGLPPCAACFLVLLAPSRLDSPQRGPEQNRLSSLPPPLLLCFPGHRTRLQPPPAGGAEGGDRGWPGGAGGREGGKSGTPGAAAIPQLGLCPGYPLPVARSGVRRPGTSLPVLGGGRRALEAAGHLSRMLLPRSRCGEHDASGA